MIVRNTTTENLYKVLEMINTKYGQNVTFTISYVNPKENLSSEQVEPIRLKIAQSVAKRYGATLVGNLTANA